MSRREYAEYRIETRWRRRDGRWGDWGGQSSSGGHHTDGSLLRLREYVEEMNAAREGEAEFRIARRWVVQDVTDWETAP